MITKGNEAAVSDDVRGSRRRGVGPWALFTAYIEAVERFEAGLAVDGAGAVGMLPVVTV